MDDQRPLGDEKSTQLDLKAVEALPSAIGEDMDIDFWTLLMECRIVQFG